MPGFYFRPLLAACRLSPGQAARCPATPAETAASPPWLCSSVREQKTQPPASRKVTRDAWCVTSQSHGCLRQCLSPAACRSSRPVCSKAASAKRKTRTKHPSVPQSTQPIPRATDARQTTPPPLRCATSRPSCVSKPETTMPRSRHETARSRNVPPRDWFQTIDDPEQMTGLSPGAS